MKFSSLVVLECVILATFSAASDENFVKMITFSFQCRTADTETALIHCGLVTPYGGIDLGQHWLS